MGDISKNHISVNSSPIYFKLVRDMSGHGRYGRVKFHPDLIRIDDLSDKKHVKNGSSFKVIPEVNSGTMDFKFGMDHPYS